MSLFGIRVKDISDTLDFILEHKASVLRFGDGELDLIGGENITYQVYDENLASRLREIIQQESNTQRVICISDIFERVERYSPFTIQFYQWHLSRFALVYRDLCRAPWYGSTFISRPYIDQADKSKSALYFHKLKQLWHNRDILIVEGYYSRSGVGNDLFDNAKSIKRILCPSRNAYAKLPAIKQAITDKVMMQDGTPRLVLLMLGPTAKILAYDFSDQFQCLDIGHIDSEYEWFKRGVTAKVKLPNKHTAEYNEEEYEKDIMLDDDPIYNAQIIARVL